MTASSFSPSACTGPQTYVYDVHWQRRTYKEPVRQMKITSLHDYPLGVMRDGPFSPYWRASMGMLQDTLTHVSHGLGLSPVLVVHECELRCPDGKSFALDPSSTWIFPSSPPSYPDLHVPVHQQFALSDRIRQVQKYLGRRQLRDPFYARLVITVEQLL